jgi:hypothetical protein
MMAANTIKLYHCSSLDEGDEGTFHTLCGLSTASESWDWPLDFMECEIGPAYGHDKCKDCENHPDLPMALLGDVDDE